MNKNKILSLFYIFFPLIMGTIIGLVTSNSIEYNNLIKPPVSPPSILFPIVWSILYLLMGISYFIYKKNIDNKGKLIPIIYYLQLFINLLWSIIFFVFELKFLAIIWIILLDLLVIFMIHLFSNENKISAYLNIPYLVWILFATYLTIGIYVLN